MNIAVYCASSPGINTAFARIATELGRWMAQHGHGLVWGAGATGLMGSVSTAVLEAGGNAHGVTTTQLVEWERPPEGFANYEVMESMSQRRERMIELADAFVALPGGPGTLEELGEIMANIKLGVPNSNLILVNVDGFYDGLVDLFRKMDEQGFLGTNMWEHLFVVDSFDDLIAKLEQLATQLA